MMKKLSILKKPAMLLLACGAAILVSSCGSELTGRDGRQSSSATAELWNDIDIVPMPKLITLSGKWIPLDDNIVLLAGSAPASQSAIGADWINRRISELGGKPLKIIKSDLAPHDKISIAIGTLSDNPVIAAAVKDGVVNVGDKNPGERGYEIKISDDGKKVYLAGADNIGALYACVTFAELIQRKGSELVWRSALVRDWPDVIKVTLGADFVGTTAMPEIMSKYRQIRSSSNPTEKIKGEYIEAVRKYYDWLLKRKVTLLGYYGPFLAGGTFEHIKGHDVIREGIEYGKDRGIGALLFAEAPFAGLAEKYPEIAKSNKCLADSGPHPNLARWIRCWSQDEICHETARNLGEYIKSTGITDIGLHDTDTGYYDNPAQWNERCDICRKRWGDDYTAATVNKFKIYYDEIKKLNPDANLHFTFYPYGVSILCQKTAEADLEGRYGSSPIVKELATKYREKYTEHWKRLHAAFPKNDVTFCIRESAPEAIEVYRGLTPGRGAFIWDALMSHAWKSFFSQAACWTPTFCDNPNDVFFINYIDTLLPLESLAVREYSWNKITPGAKPFDKWDIPLSEQWKHSEPKGEIYTLVLPNLVRNVFGREAAPYILRVVSQNIDMRQIFGQVGAQFDWLKDYKRMQWQADNAETGAKALDELWKKCIDTKSIMGMDDFAFLRFVYLRESLHMSMWMAKSRAQNLLARELAMKQDVKGAEEALRKGLEYVQEGNVDREKLRKEQPDDPVISEKPFNKWSGLWRNFMSDNADFSLAEKSLKQTASELKELGSLGAAPKHVTDAISADRVVRAKKTDGKITLDGKLSEEAWKDAYPIETFLVLNKGAQAATAWTRVKMLYDKENIYVAMNCHVPGEDESIPEKDTVELFLTSPEMKGDYVHLFIGSNGVLKQQYNKAEGPDGAIKWTADNSWVCPGIVSAVSPGWKKWNAEIRIPISAMGGVTEKNAWQVNIARSCPLTAEVEMSSILSQGSSGFHDLKKFCRLVWTENPCPPPSIQVEALAFKVETQTLKDAIASVAEIKLEVESNVVLNDVRVTLEGYGNDGRLQCMKTIEIDRVFYKWTASDFCVLEYQQICKSGGVLVKVSAKEGNSEHWFRFGGWQGTDKTGNIFALGLDGGKGISGECHFTSVLKIDAKDVQLFNGACGTVEFWVKPSWQGYRDPPMQKSDIFGECKTFVHYGPGRKDNPRIINNSPLSISYYGNNSSIACTLYNGNYAGWVVSAPVGADKSWTPGIWHHVACVWDVSAKEKDMLKIFIDGKCISRSPLVNKPDRLPEKLTAILETKNPFPIQIGSLNSGFQPSESVIDELRISRIVRYKDEFKPDMKEFVTDKDTSALFHFNGSLSGEGLTDDGKSYIIEAVSGASGMRQ